MQVFISWSGEQSHAVALSLRTHLPKMLAQRITPFVSTEDISKGARGLDTIAAQLEESKFGVVVVTPENQASPWINFEAGALGRSVANGRVAPLLVGLGGADLDGPLKQFQYTAATDEKAVLSLVASINESLPEPFDPETLATLFGASWPQLETDISAALDLITVPAPKRDSDDLLDEILTTVRTLRRDVDGLRAATDTNARMNEWQQVVNDALPALRNARVHTDPRSLNQQLLNRMIGSALSGSETGWGSGYHHTDGLYVLLEDNAPQVRPDILTDIQGLARSQRQPIAIRRHNGSWIKFDQEGNETRGQDAHMSYGDMQNRDAVDESLRENGEI